tara:strand:+ start:1742 stop:1930 length:189 start_codon:yes stop_codon:yes gene_type:complete
MINKKNKVCYIELMKKLDSLDVQLCRVKEQVSAIRDLVQTTETQKATDTAELCPNTQEVSND